MPPLRHGARQILIKLKEDTYDIRENRTDHDLVCQLAYHIDELLDLLEPKLQRAESDDLGKRVAALEQIVEELRKELQQSRIRRVG